MNILRKKEKNLHDFTSFLMMISLKSFHKLSSQLQCSLTWKKYLKILIPLSLITKSKLSPCFQLRKRKSILLRMLILIRKTLKIGWMRSKIWWRLLFDMNLRIQLTSIQKQKGHNGHAIILDSVFSMGLKYGGRL